MRVLVTGATGNVGRLVVDHLVRAGGVEVRALTTNPGKARLPAGVEVVTGYLGRIDTLPPALAGVDRMYLAPLPGTVTEVLSAAREAGVQANAPIDLGDIAALATLALLAEHPQRPVDTVPRLTGRPGTTFAEWAVRHADDFR